jgi:glyoxylase-like metal-dependent hydrolase (beta-lactamase superfamily II)
MARHSRPALAVALALATALLAPLAARADGPPVAERLPEKALDVVRLADGVYAAIWREPLRDPIEGNALWIVNADHVIVVDSSLFPSSARRMIAELEKLTDKPVRYLVNTHWHDDHHGGNAVYRERWPGVTIVAHPATRANMIEHTYKPRPGLLDEYRAATEKYRKWAATGLDDDGKPLVETRRKRAGEIVTLLATAVAELEASAEMPPDLTFSDRLVLDPGGRGVEVRWLGRGNTAGDVVVVLPRERIAATGDLTVFPVPFGFGSYYEEWIATLAAVDAQPIDTIVPGHGPVMRDRDYLHTLRALLGDLVAQAKQAVADGLTLEQAQERIKLPEWRAKLCGDDVERGRAFDAYWLAPAVERAWRQAKGEDPPEGRA